MPSVIACVFIILFIRDQKTAWHGIILPELVASRNLTDILGSQGPSDPVGPTLLAVIGHRIPFFDGQIIGRRGSTCPRDIKNSYRQYLQE